MKNIRTKIRINGLTEKQAKILGNVFEGKAPFETLYPIPSSLKICTDSAIAEAVSDSIREYLRKRPRDIRLERPDAGQHIIDHIGSLGIETKGKTLEAVQNSIQAYRNTGYASSKKWKIDRWGCSCEPLANPLVIITKDSNSEYGYSLEATIDTEGSEPNGISRKISCQFPEAEVIQSHACISDEKCCARIIFHSGKIISRFYPDPLDLGKWTDEIYITENNPNLHKRSKDYGKQ